jgi:hypothetical protein
MSDECLISVQNRANTLIAKHLDTGKCYSRQNKAARQKFCDEVTVLVGVAQLLSNSSFKMLSGFPALKSFKNHWPLIDLMQMRLKTTAARERRKKKDKMVTHLAKAIRG